MTVPRRAVCLYADGAQNSAHFDRGIARYVVEHARAIYDVDPGALQWILLNPGLPLPGSLSPLFGTGLLTRNHPCAGWGAEQRPLIYHVMSPFESTPIDILWPPWARDSRIATVVTLYDLIPLLFADQYLGDPAFRADYHARLEFIRHADYVLAISQTTANDAVEHLELDPRRVGVIHAGASTRFVSPYPSPMAALDQLARELRSIRPGFILYVGGFDFRKNLEGLIAAYALLPEALRARHQLVIACRLAPSQAELLLDTARNAGLSPDDVVLTGYVSDADLAALYTACSLFVFPSLYEGSGLPILEAMSCGAAVAASRTSTSPELLGDMDATFDPNDPSDIARCLTDVISCDETLARLRDRSRRRAAKYTWRAVAQRTVAAYELALRAPIHRRSRRARVALVTPWPPGRSPAAAASRSLTSELSKLVDVDVVASAERTNGHFTPEAGRVRLISAADFADSRDAGRYDRVIYRVGPTLDYASSIELAVTRPGVVLFDDVRLTAYYLAADGEAGLIRRIRAAYGRRIPDHIEMVGSDAVTAWRSWGVYLSGELQDHALACLVHSEAAADVLRLDREPGRPDVPVAVIPIAFGGRDVSVATASVGPRSVVGLAANGDVASVEYFGRIVGALGHELGSGTSAVLATAHPSPEATGAPRDEAEDGSGARTELLDGVGAEQLHELLRDAAAAVAIGEADFATASLAGMCLGSGVPTIVPNLGWCGDLPDDVVVKVQPDASAGSVAEVLRALLRDSAERERLDGAARRHAAEHTHAAVAREVVRALGLA